MQYTMEIAGCRRELPLCPISESVYIGAFILFGDVELTTKTAAALLEKAPDFDVLVTAESKGIPLCYEMARQSGKPYVVARKGAKLYMEDILTARVQSITTRGEQTLCIGKKEKEALNGKRVLVVDDVISTGESLRVIDALVKQAGGKIIGEMAVLAEGEAADRKDIIFLEKLPLFDKEGNPLA
ncbi:MAG: adenine phosphoribosyltransferase [Clostridia bacterium]|nr:adenine phosphoribosyltransferase [Oscillospiraceae bacterium]MBQ7034078.1 adenine phosphoribosyltransferase [Clostridia bacterium]